MKSVSERRFIYTNLSVIVGILLTLTKKSFNHEKKAITLAKIKQENNFSN
jgi:hypothetical protein